MTGGLKCCPCTDDLVTRGGSYPETDLPDAVTLVPVMQTFSGPGGSVAAPVMMPVCFACRQKQLGRVSKNGLLTA